MRTLMLSAALSVGTLVGLAPTRADASRLGEAPHARYELASYGDPSCASDTTTYGFGTSSGDTYDLLYHMMPPYASYPGPSIRSHARPSHDRSRMNELTTPGHATATVRGQVSSVSADKDTFILGDLYGKVWTFHRAASPGVSGNTTGCPSAGLNAGDHVAVTYGQRGTRLVVITIQYSDRMAGLMIPPDTHR